MFAGVWWRSPIKPGKWRNCFVFRWQSSVYRLLQWRVYHKRSDIRILRAWEVLAVALASLPGLRARIVFRSLPVLTPFHWRKLCSSPIYILNYNSSSPAFPCSWLLGIPVAMRCRSFSVCDPTTCNELPVGNSHIHKKSRRNNSLLTRSSERIPC